ncbi:MAG: hypothetical protein IRZ09_07235 [Variibacter sp.]|nr:hypothetical protein [Variibacter sp.]
MSWRRHVVLGSATVAACCVLGANARGDCTCRAAGRNFQLGASVCLPAPEGPRLATCEMVLNNTSWRFSSTPCPDVNAGPPAGTEPETLPQHAALAESAH